MRVEAIAQLLDQLDAVDVLSGRMQASTARDPHHLTFLNEAVSRYAYFVKQNTGERATYYAFAHRMHVDVRARASNRDDVLAYLSKERHHVQCALQRARQRSCGYSSDHLRHPTKRSHADMTSHYHQYPVRADADGDYTNFGLPPKRPAYAYPSSSSFAHVACTS
ncbi:hypothetical protein DYB38_002034 [Aphanomyces astaci]|uniref:Uncharacterized protein n=1 Tax=Aphanomyces astaci TaxID=112090 RepID=A0A397CX64_APHAT|nr:hypothetical protein DYB38_002034 [Aphanomyces astaci]